VSAALPVLPSFPTRRSSDLSLEIAEPVNEVMEIAARPGVEPGGRLVEEEERGTSDDRHRHIEASSLTSGEGLQLLVGLFLQADHAQEFVDRPGVDIGAVEVLKVGQQFARLPCAGIARGQKDDADL